MFKAVKAVRGVPRVLGRDARLYTIVEIDGFPEVVNVEVVLLLYTQSKPILEDQVVYGARSCGLLANPAAQTWCTGRILNTNAHGLATATTSRTFGSIRITAKTYQSNKGPSPPVVSIDIAPAVQRDAIL